MYTPNIVFVHNEIMLAFLLQNIHDFTMYKNNGNKNKTFLHKSMEIGLVKKALKQDD